MAGTNNPFMHYVDDFEKEAEEFLGLSLDCTEMTEVLKLGGMTFIPGNRDHEAYKYLFTAMYGKGIDECNAFLEEVGVETLGTKQRL